MSFLFNKIKIQVLGLFILTSASVTLKNLELGNKYVTGTTLFSTSRFEFNTKNVMARSVPLENGTQWNQV